MSEIILITGGCRSGKSKYAESLAYESDGKKLYIATAPILDDEMLKRVNKHKENRAGLNWDTIEEETDLKGVFSNNATYDTILVDCLTLWINNLMFKCEINNIEINEDFIINKVTSLLHTIRKLNCRVLFVINEVGMGIVPESKQARLFRDLSGRCSQLIAEAADSVVLMSCGLPVKLK